MTDLLPAASAFGGLGPNRQEHGEGKNWVAMLGEVHYLSRSGLGGSATSEALAGIGMTQGLWRNGGLWGL